MASCTRYSIAVYLGLLLAGALFAPKPEPAAWAVYGDYWWAHTPPIVRPQPAAAAAARAQWLPTSYRRTSVAPPAIHRDEARATDSASSAQAATHER